MVDGTIEGTAYKGSGMREGTNSSDDFEVLSQSTGYLYPGAPWKGHGSAVFFWVCAARSASMNLNPTAFDLRALSVVIRRTTRRWKNERRED